MPWLSKEIKDFFEYQSLLMKPWDGPASIAFTDGKKIGAHLDRNGLRPARYVLTEDGILVLGSEVGMVDLGDRKVLKKGRLGPGDTLVVDLSKGEVKETEEILKELASQKPYGEWLEKHLVRLWKIIKDYSIPEPKDDPDRIRKLVAFGYTQEEIKHILAPMAEEGKEITFSMGDDTPIPPLSETAKRLGTASLCLDTFLSESTTMLAPSRTASSTLLQTISTPILRSHMLIPSYMAS